MKIKFTTTDMLVSKIIRWMFNEESTHFTATLYNDQVIFQSNFFGVDFSSFKAFSLHAKVIHEFDIPMTREQEDIVFDSLVESMVGNKYDFKALIYFGFRGLLKKFLGIPLPKTNKWQTKDQNLCTELAYGLPDDVIPPGIKGMDLSMVTAERLYKMLKIYRETGKIVEL